MIIKVRCTDAIGNAILRLIAAIEVISSGGDYKAYGDAVRRLIEGVEAIVPDYKPEDLQFELDSSDQRAAGGGPRTHYWARLPQLPDGTFDMTQVPSTIEQNLRSVGAHTVNGIIYNDIVQGTLNGDVITEPGLRAARMMKAGSSQRAVQQLFHAGLIDRGPITA